MATAAEKLDTGIITEWRSIVTLIVFVLTSKSAHKSRMELMTMQILMFYSLSTSPSTFPGDWQMHSSMSWQP